MDVDGELAARRPNSKLKRKRSCDQLALRKKVEKRKVFLQDLQHNPANDTMCRDVNMNISVSVNIFSPISAFPNRIN